MMTFGFGNTDQAAYGEMKVANTAQNQQKARPPPQRPPFGQVVVAEQHVAPYGAGVDPRHLADVRHVTF